MYKSYIGAGKMERGDLVFFVNGRKISIASPNPETTLLQYLRRTSVYLSGTKEACGQGACGACTVMVSYYDRGQNSVVHFSTNACLVPICYLHGMAITTVEGVGSTKDGLHIIQENLVNSFGLQCGFCTPGMVMSMYTFYRNNPNPTQDDLERVLEGNLCRCTGYRPILDAFKKSCPCGLNLCNQPSNDTVIKQTTEEPPSENKKDSTQDVIFPSELKLRAEYTQSSILFKGEKYTWARPVTLAETFQLLTAHPDATLVMGCTYIGYQMKNYALKSDVIICGTHVREMNVLRVTDGGVEIGGAVTFGTLERFLKKSMGEMSEYKQKSVKAMLSALRWLAMDQVRNIASIGGHVMSKAPNHDLQTFLMASGAKLNFQSKTNKTFTMEYDNVFVQNGKGAPGSGEVLVSITVPLTTQDEYLYFFKQPHRRGMDYAIVNAGAYAKVNNKTKKLDSVRVCYGNIASRPRVITEFGPIDITKQWSDDLTAGVTAAVEKEFLGSETDNLQFKLTLATSFFFKFFLRLQEDTKTQAQTSDSQGALGDTVNTDMKSAQYYDVPDKEGNRVVWQPTHHTSAKPISAGEAIFVDDLPTFSNELFLAHVLSEKPHAKIISVDTTVAMETPGVVAFIDHKDVPGHQIYGAIAKDTMLFAVDEVLFVGQPVSAIIATTREVARRAAKMVKVTYQEIPALLTIDDAIKADALYPQPYLLQRGDVDKALQEAELTLEGEIETGSQEHFYLEPHVCLVVPKKEHGEIEIFSSTQGLHEMQAEVSLFLNIPRNKIVTKVKRLGGGFGGKAGDTVHNAGIAAVAAWKLGQPIRSVYDRARDMRFTGKRHGMKCTYKVGFDKTGKISAFVGDVYLNAGYSTDVSPFVGMFVIMAHSLPYNFPNFKMLSKLCKTNLPSNTAMRGFGTPQGTFLRENVITDIAKKLGMDANEVRAINMYKEGDSIIHGNNVIEDFTLLSCIDKCKQQAGYDKACAEILEFNKSNKWKKRGLAMSNVMYPMGYPPIMMNQAGALVHVYLDGSVLVTHGGIEMGQGVHTKVCQVAATVLDIPLEKIHISEISTDKVPNATESGGSYVADLNAGAVKVACNTIMERLAPLRATKPEATWEELVNMAYLSRISLSASGYYCPTGRKEGHDLFKNEGQLCEYYTYGSVCSQVEIDCLTGEHRVLKTDIVMDLGKSLNPAIDVGQIEGGFMMGCGMMTSEQITLNPRGYVEQYGPVNYKVPGIRNIPQEFNVTLLKEVKGGGSIYTSKGIGEPPFLLGVSVHLALKEAVMAARADHGFTDNYRLPCPATPDKIRLACADPFSQKFSRFHEKEKKIVL